VTAGATALDYAHRQPGTLRTHLRSNLVASFPIQLGLPLVQAGNELRPEARPCRRLVDSYIDLGGLVRYLRTWRTQVRQPLSESDPRSWLLVLAGEVAAFAFAFQQWTGGGSILSRFLGFASLVAGIALLGVVGLYLARPSRGRLGEAHRPAPAPRYLHQRHRTDPGHHHQVVGAWSGLRKV
jgi:hypothetical protein